MFFRLLFIVLCETIVSIYSWGPTGHGLVTHLAQSQLTDNALDWVRDLIPWHWNGNLSSMASWADNILYPDTNPTGYPNWQWSRPLHYINTPDWSCNYLYERDCIDKQCVDGAIKNYTQRLEMPLDHIQHEEALYFLIHYVGDIHQPLHTGFKSDYGGNNVRGHFMNVSGQTNLHSVWDSGIVEYRLKYSFNSNLTLYYDYIYQLMINQPQIDNEIEQWINENLNIVCQYIYFDDENNQINSTKGFNLTEIYYQRSYPIVEQRLAQAGYRLGILLNRLGGNGLRKVTKQTCVDIYFLIGGLICEFLLGILIFVIYKITRCK